MSEPVTLGALVRFLLRQRMASPDTVWRLSFREAADALRLAGGPASHSAPTASDLAALMRAFPDQPSAQGSDHGG